jgi:hypothetical protein
MIILQIVFQNGRSPLLEACGNENYNVAMVQYLIMNGADVTVVDQVN